MNKFKAELMADGYVVSVVTACKNFGKRLKRTGAASKKMPRCIYASIRSKCFSTPLKFKYSIRTIYIFLVFLVLAVLFFLNTNPFNETFTIGNSTTNGDFTYTPSNRYSGFQTGEIAVKNQRLYFMTTLPKKYDKADLNVTFQTKSPDHLLSIGYEQQDSKTFNDQYINVPYLNSINQSKLSNSGLHAFSKSTRNISSMNIAQLFSFAAQDNLTVGSLGVDQSTLQANTTVPGNYYASNKPTIIRPAIRGSAVLYVYLENQPLHLNITKQNLNFEAGPAKITVTVYNPQGNQVYVNSVGKTYSHSSNRVLGQPETMAVNLGGNKAVASGTYKVVVTSNNNILLSQVQANTNKIVFDGPLYWVGNSSIYSLKSPSNPHIYSNASLLSASTQHSGSIQTVTYGQKNVAVAQSNQPYFTKTMTTGLQSLTAPKGDLILNANGFFAFSPSQFFVPYTNKVLVDTNGQDLRNSDIILTNYSKPSTIGKYYQAEVTYPLSNVDYLKGSVMVWRIFSNKPPSTQDTTKIKHISITFTRYGWLHL